MCSYIHNILSRRAVLPLVRRVLTFSGHDIYKYIHTCTHTYIYYIGILLMIIDNLAVKLKYNLTLY